MINSLQNAHQIKYRSIAIFFYSFVLFLMVGCADNTAKNSEVIITGAMKDVMWKGKLAGVIELDTIQNREGLYGLGPLSYLKGEILIVDGEQYVSRISDKGKPTVAVEEKVEAPFFVHANATNWVEYELPEKVVTTQDLEAFITEKTTQRKKPFVLKVEGHVNQAVYHIQNLADNSIVTSPDEAHAGQQSFEITDKTVTIVGFYSADHKGVFTHHDSNVHLHIITEDKTAMGHLDELELAYGGATLYIAE